jgi:hypothetical protein
MAVALAGRQENLSEPISLGGPGTGRGKRGGQAALGRIAGVPQPQREAVSRHVAAAGGVIVAEFQEIESGKKNDRPQLGIKNAPQAVKPLDPTQVRLCTTYRSGRKWPPRGRPRLPIFDRNRSKFLRDKRY